MPVVALARLLGVMPCLSCSAVSYDTDDAKPVRDFTRAHTTTVLLLASLSQQQHAVSHSSVHHFRHLKPNIARLHIRWNTQSASCRYIRKKASAAKQESVA